MKDFQSAYNDEIQQRLKEMPFPKSQMPEHFMDWAAIALRYESKQSLNCDTQTLLRLHEVIGNPNAAPLNFFEAGFLINAIEQKTPEQLGVSNYPMVMAATEAMTIFWNETVQPIKEGIMRKLQAQQRISQGVPGNKKIIGKA